MYIFISNFVLCVYEKTVCIGSAYDSKKKKKNKSTFLYYFLANFLFS